MKALKTMFITGNHEAKVKGVEHMEAILAFKLLDSLNMNFNSQVVRASVFRIAHVPVGFM